MKTIQILDTHVRVSAIESLRLFPKIGEKGIASVNISTRMLSFNLEFNTNEEAEEYIKKILDLMND